MLTSPRKRGEGENLASLAMTTAKIKMPATGAGIFIRSEIMN
jgi:hypothetical protein